MNVIDTTNLSLVIAAITFIVSVIAIKLSLDHVNSDEDSDNKNHIYYGLGGGVVLAVLVLVLIRQYKLYTGMNNRLDEGFYTGTPIHI